MKYSIIITSLWAFSQDFCSSRTKPICFFTISPMKSAPHKRVHLTSLFLHGPGTIMK